MAIVLPVAAGDHIDTGFALADIALVLAGSALGGAVLGAAGALIGAVARHPGLAMGIVVVWSISESLATRRRNQRRHRALPALPARRRDKPVRRRRRAPGDRAAPRLPRPHGARGRRWALPRDLT